MVRECNSCVTREPLNYKLTDLVDQMYKQTYVHTYTLLFAI